LVIWRPTIIASAEKDPFSGWTDTMSAAGVISTLSGLGFFHVLRIFRRSILDVIPVDHVSNGILIATCYGGTEPFSPPHVFNNGSSHANPISMRRYIHGMIKCYDKITLDKNVTPIIALLSENEQAVKIMKYFIDDLPFKTFYYYNKLINNQKLIKDSQTALKFKKKINEAFGSFNFFIDGYWKYKSEKIMYLVQMLPKD